MEMKSLTKEQMKEITKVARKAGLKMLGIILLFSFSIAVLNIVSAFLLYSVSKQTPSWAYQAMGLLHGITGFIIFRKIQTRQLAEMNSKIKEILGK